MSYPANRTLSRSIVGHLPRWFAPLPTAGMLALMLSCLLGGCGNNSASSGGASSSPLRPGTWYGEMYTKPLNVQFTTSGNAVKMKWRPAVRITQKTIAFGNVYLGLTSNIPPKAIERAINNSGLHLPPTRIPNVGYTEYEPAHEFTVLEHTGDLVTLKVHLEDNSTQLVQVELKGDDLLIGGRHFSPAQMQTK